MNKPREYRLARIQGDVVVNPPHDVTLRVNDLKAMKHFYQHSLGFKLVGEFPSAVLLKVGDRPGSQTQMLALLQRSLGAGPDRSAVGRVAFIIPAEAHEPERKRLQSLGLGVDSADYERTGKRSLCVRDPEGNLVELLCADPTLTR